ncbi:hypothetical protein D3C80_387970 [compost metagenome]
MSPENFVYWLQGAFELGQLDTLNEQQVKIVKDHIALVLKKVTPELGKYPYSIQNPPPFPPGGIGPVIC